MSNLTRFNSLFDDAIFNDFFRPRLSNDSADRAPAIDVRDSEGQYLVKVDLPGISKDDIHISLDNGVLTISAETATEDSEEHEGKLIRQERHYGKFVRSLSVGADVDPSGIRASFDNGVLNLTLPKMQELPPSSVSIDIE